MGGNESKESAKGAAVMGEESIMSKKKNGTTEDPVQENLRFNCDPKLASKICCYNRHYAEPSGYFKKNSSFLESVPQDKPFDFYDSVSGEKLFTAAKNRSFEEFVKESKAHGWPSFRDDEVNWEKVRVLPGGECVSVDGTHLGHNIPDAKGNRFCINLVSIAGQPTPTPPPPPSSQMD